VPLVEEASVDIKPAEKSPAQTDVQIQEAPLPSEAEPVVENPPTPSEAEPVVEDPPAPLE
ncbi:hypothetical protein XENOCAPTIV_007285, partial [Xenoophorus captivus]